MHLSELSGESGEFHSRLSTVTDPASRTYTYGYDTQDRLVTVTYPDTRLRTYVYENDALPFALTGIIDERNLRLSTYTYDADGRATTTERAGAENRFVLWWTLDGPTNKQAGVTDAFGQGHTYNFSVINGALKLTSQSSTYEGSRSKTYDANGNVAS